MNRTDSSVIDMKTARHEVPFDMDDFRSVMRQFAGAVCIISTDGSTGTHGFTATAVCSVCAEPPTLLVVVNRSARTHSHIRQNQAFTINFLAEDQRSVAELLSTKTINQFSQVAHRADGDGSISIDGALGYLHCTLQDEFDIGTHTIFIGRVTKGEARSGAPLIYQAASFWGLAPLEELANRRLTAS